MVQSSGQHTPGVSGSGQDRAVLSPDEIARPGRPAMIRLIALVVVILASGACRTLPREYDREDSFALEPATDGPVAGFADDCASRLTSETSAFMLLDDAAEALRWRLALIDAAETSIDIQTFLWNGDFAGYRIMDRVIKAAERGVRVRILVDDFHLRNGDHLIAALDVQRNIGVRVWNPGRNRLLGRKLEFLLRLSELNHRMHNKLLVIDNRVAISGGRNIGNEYFGLSSKYNMIDLDLLAVGPVVPETSAMFDRYWNAEQAVPGILFSRGTTTDDLAPLSARIEREAVTSPLCAVFPVGRGTWDDRLDDAVGAMVPGEVEVIYDRPAVREPSQDAMYGLQRFFERAERDILVVNPYFVPGDGFADSVGQLTARGITIAVMTNSLGSNNQTIVHPAFARKRRMVLSTGTDLYELRHDPGLKSDLDVPPTKSKFIGLHGKAAVLDHEHVFIGSFNLCPRSRDLNTEMGLLVRSPELGDQVAEVLSDLMAPENAWRVLIDENGRMYWESSEGIITSEPAQSFWQRVKRAFYGMLPVEKHL